MQPSKGVMLDIERAQRTQERARRYQRLLKELVLSGLYEDDEGLVRPMTTDVERVDMHDKLLNAGHELDAASRELELARERASADVCGRA